MLRGLFREIREAQNSCLVVERTSIAIRDVRGSCSGLRIRANDSHHSMTSSLCARSIARHSEAESPANSISLLFLDVLALAIPRT